MYVDEAADDADKGCECFCAINVPSLRRYLYANAKPPLRTSSRMVYLPASMSTYILHLFRSRFLRHPLPSRPRSACQLYPKKHAEFMIKGWPRCDAQDSARSSLHRFSHEALYSCVIHLRSIPARLACIVLFIYNYA